MSLLSFKKKNSPSILASKLDNFPLAIISKKKKILYKSSINVERLNTTHSATFQMGLWKLKFTKLRLLLLLYTDLHIPLSIGKRYQCSSLSLVTRSLISLQDTTITGFFWLVTITSTWTTQTTVTQKHF